MIKAVIFDLDGTLADTIPLTVYSLKEVARELAGKELSDDEILKEFGPIDTEIIRKLVDNDKSDISVEAYVEHFSKNFKSFIKPIDGITELIKFIKSKGLKIGLFTGRSHRVTKIILENMGIEQYFDEILAGDFTAKPKPDPEGINITLKKLNVKSSEAIYAGDFEADVLASKAAGTTSVLALWASTGAKELIKLKPDKYFNTPYEFIEWLESLSKMSN